MQEKECTYTTAQVGRYLMNKMSPEEETLFQEHLISCPACCRKLQEMRNLAAALSANPPFTREERMQETPLRENTRLHRSLFLRELRHLLVAIPLHGRRSLSTRITRHFSPRGHAQNSGHA